MQTTLYQLELDYREINCGMSYVFHLRDGRFFIIDGGYFTPGEEDRLYDFLKERCGGGTPVVAGWYFSHAHQDHVGCFINFIWKYRGQVAIEQLIYNFQPVDFSTISGDWKSSDPATVKEFYRTIDEACGGIPVKAPHAGDVFQIGEITVEVLYTQEDLYPKKASFNDYSTVITTQVAGQKILWLGDIRNQASRILLRKKKDRLACDIVQVAHHGFGGATRALYAKTRAWAALWPTADYCMKKITSTKENRANAFVLKKMQEHWVGGHGTAALALPYHAGTAVSYPKKFVRRQK
jgi:hypothetical protein